jgi:hypothetical protein
MLPDYSQGCGIAIMETVANFQQAQRKAEKKQARRRRCREVEGREVEKISPLETPAGKGRGG